jgi:peroxiredoxin
VKPDPGDFAPDFRLELLGGRSVCLGDFRGRPLVLVFLRHLA